MRYMDFGDVEEVGWTVENGTMDLTPDASRAGIAMLSYMMFPEDPDARASWQATNGAIALQGLEQVHAARREEVVKTLGEEEATEMFNTLKNRIHQRDFLRTGGLSAVVNGLGLKGYSDHMDSVSRQIWLTGMIFLIFLAMKRHHAKDFRFDASYRKVVFLMTKTRGTNRNELQISWAARNSIAHLCAAAIIMDTRADDDAWDSDFPPFVRAVLQLAPEVAGVAAAFEAESDSFIAHGQKSNGFIPPGKLWRVPRHAVREITTNIAPLSDADLKTLKAYRATR